MTRLQQIRAWGRRHAYSLLSSLGTLWRRWLGTLLTATVIGIALLLPLALYLSVNALSGFESLRNELGSVTVFLTPDADSAEAESLATRLEAQPGIASVNRISPQEALAEFKLGSGFGDAVDALPENPLPWVLVLEPDSAAVEEGTFDLNALMQLLEADAGVDFAQYDRQWLDRLASLLDLIRAVVQVLGLLLGLGVMLVVGNTVRLDIQSRQREIQVLALSGASEAFIRRPFLYAGFWYGLLGGLIAVGLLLLARQALAEPLADLLVSYQLNPAVLGLPLAPVLWTIAAGALLGLVGASLAVRQHLRHFRIV